MTIVLECPGCEALIDKEEMDEADQECCPRCGEFRAEMRERPVFGVCDRCRGDGLA